MSINLADVERIVRSHLFTYRDDIRFEDAVQEALIRAWKDMDGGNEDFHHVTNRAKNWARGFIQKPYSRATGSPSLSRDGVSNEMGEQKRMKIISYVHEFTKLHDRKPSNKEVSNGLGIPMGTVSKQRINIATGKYDHAVYEAEGDRRRISSTYFKPVYLEDTENQDTLAKDRGFEREAVAQLDFERLLDQVTPTSKTVLHLLYSLQYTRVEAADALSMTVKSLETRIQWAHDEIQSILDPAFVEARIPECPNGHRKTEDNVVLQKQGRISRCRICYNATQKRKSEKRRRREGKPLKSRTHCAENHEITGLRKDGKRFCEVCNNAKRRKDAKDKGVLTDDQVREIRAHYIKTAVNKSNIAELAEKFGVSHAVIHNVVNYKRYKHVE